MSKLWEETCKPSNVDMPKTTVDEALSLLVDLEGWHIDNEGNRILRTLRLKNFMQAMKLFNQIAEIAEKECHHPDLHLRSYRHVEIAFWTHTVNGLSRNDFIMAAKVDRLIDNL